MSEFEVLTRGGEAIKKQLEARHARIRRNSRQATRASAIVFQKAVRRVLPKRTGSLRRHVKLFPIGETGWKVKVTGRTAHLALGQVGEHAIEPRDAAAANSGRRRAIGPVLARRALSFPGASHPFPRAIIPAHSGDQTLIPRARAEASGEARIAAMEVLKS